MADQPLTRIDELLAFLPAFEVEGRVFVERWQQLPGTPPYPVYAEDVAAFFRLAGQPWWSDYAYDPQQARRKLEDNVSIARAGLGEIKTMLTYCVRGERFSDGFWGHLLETGRIQILLRRLAILRQDSTPQESSTAHPG